MGLTVDRVVPLFSLYRGRCLGISWLLAVAVVLGQWRDAAQPLLHTHPRHGILLPRSRRGNARWPAYRNQPELAEYAIAESP